MDLIGGWKTIFVICLFVTTVISLPVVERSYSKSDDNAQSESQNKEQKKPKSLTISIQRPEPLHESFNDELTDDEAEVLLPKALKRRAGRFLFDLLDGSDASSMSSYMTDGSDDFFSGLGRLFNLNVDQNAVMTVNKIYLYSEVSGGEKGKFLINTITKSIFFLLNRESLLQRTLLFM